MTISATLGHPNAKSFERRIRYGGLPEDSCRLYEERVRGRGFGNERIVTVCS